MTRPKRRPVEARSAGQLTAAARLYLTAGQLDPADPEALTVWLSKYPDRALQHGLPWLGDAWSRHGAKLTRQWIQEHPGTRPRGWWMYGDGRELERPDPEDERDVLRRGGYLEPGE